MTEDSPSDHFVDPPFLKILYSDGDIHRGVVFLEGAD